MIRLRPDGFRPVSSFMLKTQQRKMDKHTLRFTYKKDRD